MNDDASPLVGKQQVSGFERELILPEVLNGVLPNTLAWEISADEATLATLERNRYERARMYLGDDWKVISQFTWVRSYKGAKLFYYVLRDSLSIRVKGEKHARWLPNAFVRLYVLINSEGLEVNALPMGKQKAQIKLPRLDTLTKADRVAVNRTPPSLENLRLTYNYDADWQVLYKVNAELERSEIVLPRLLIEIDGVEYSYARVVSMLLFGNPYGVPDAEKRAEILNAYPKVESNFTLGEIMAALPSETEQKKQKQKPKMRQKRNQKTKLAHTRPPNSMTWRQRARFDRSLK